MIYKIFDCMLYPVVKYAMFGVILAMGIGLIAHEIIRGEK